MARGKKHEVATQPLLPMMDRVEVRPVLRGSRVYRTHDSVRPLFGESVDHKNLQQMADLMAQVLHIVRRP